MPVAGFFKPLQTVAPPMPRGAAAAAGGDAASSGSLQGFVVPHQLQTEWCWAAVSCGVAAFYGPSQWTQCSIAAAELAPLNCCGSNGSGACNQYGYLDRALARVGHLDHISAPTTSFIGVQGEIGGGRALGCRIAGAGGPNSGAHFASKAGRKAAA